MAILDFLDSTYAGAATLMEWDPEFTHVTVPPATAGDVELIGGHHA